MGTPRPADPQDFSQAGYRRILARARALGYAVQSFDRFTPPAQQPVLLLRHDLDHSLRAAVPLAELELEHAVRSTYFVQVTCDFYNILGREGRSIVARLISLGHDVGLHYDARRYAEAHHSGGAAAAARRLRLDIALLEDLAGCPVASASQHLPCDTADFDVRQAVTNEAYDDRFTTGPMAYISDSLLAWRQATPHDLLDQRASFQFLTHPMKWAAPVACLHDVLERAFDEECAALRGQYDEVETYYAGLLERRAELDAKFRARRARA